MGLIGELLFLKDQLSKSIGFSEALKSWSGQELTHKDFSYGDTWTEVKTIRRSSQSVRISSLEQLDSEYDGELAVYALEKMSPEYKGITLNKLIVEMRNLFRITMIVTCLCPKWLCRGMNITITMMISYMSRFTIRTSGLIRIFPGSHLIMSLKRLQSQYMILT